MLRPSVRPIQLPAWEHPSRSRHSHKAQGSNHRLLPTPLPVTLAHTFGARAHFLSGAERVPHVRRGTEAWDGNANGEGGEINVSSRIHRSSKEFNDSQLLKRHIKIRLINPCPLLRQFRITDRQWAGCCQQTPCRSDEPLRRHLFLLFLRPYFHIALQFLLYLLIGVFGGEGKNTT